MSMLYTEKLTDPRWQKKRLSILNRDNWTCQACWDTKTTLNIHHRKYSGLPWDSPDEDLVTVCRHCHDLISLYKIDLSIYAFLPCTKLIGHGMVVSFFNTPSDLILGIFRHNDPIFHTRIPNSDMRNVIQSIMNNWLVAGNDHLLIDQSPI